MDRLNQIVRAICTATSVVLLGGCASFETESFWGPAHRLSGLGSGYAWKQGATCDPESGKSEVPDVEATLRDQIEVDLAKKGYRGPAEAKPDFLVCYRLGKVVTQATTGHASWDDAVVEVDLTDPSSGQLVWRGRVRGRIDYAAAPEARRSRLESAVRQLLQPLPKAGGS